MKKEELLKLFPCFTNQDIKVLPTELVVCWYPSSGSGCNHETNFSGYNIPKHWKEQPSNLKPNLFIFTDVDEFEIHEEAEVLFTRSFYEDSIIELLRNPIIVDYELIPHDHYFHQCATEQVKDDFLHLFSLGIVSIGGLIKGLENLDEFEFNKLQIKWLLESDNFDKESIIKIIKERNQIVAGNLIDGTVDSIKTITLIYYLESYFLLVQTTNKYIYNLFIAEEIKIPLLTLNRPMDPFILDKGIDIKTLGIQEFIAGHIGVSGLMFDKEFTSHSDFIFKICGTGYVDLANFYSRRNL